MKIEKAVFDASPLILLFKSSRADLLPRLFAEIVVPEAVWEEVMAGGESDIAAAGVSSAAWIQRVKAPGTAPEVVAWNLGGGESEVLTFALTHPDYVAVIDDHAARSCARTLGVRALGTGGALVLAKRRGLISSVSVELKILQDAGLWLSEEIVALLREQAGETD